MVDYQANFELEEISEAFDRVIRFEERSGFFNSSRLTHLEMAKMEVFDELWKIHNSKIKDPEARNEAELSRLVACYWR